MGGCATKLTDAFSRAEAKALAAGSVCPTTGDAAAVLARLNGAYQPANALPKWFSGTRFVDNGDGTVSDTLAGLMGGQRPTTARSTTRTIFTPGA